MRRRIMIIALTILCLLLISWSICVAKTRKVSKDFIPPTIPHDGPSTVSLLYLPVEAAFVVEDNKEIAYYVVQYDQVPDRSQTVYVPEGIVSQNFSVPLDFRDKNNSATLLAAAADSAGNISRLVLNVTLDTDCPGCDLTCYDLDIRGVYQCSTYFGIDFSYANLSGASFRGQHLAENNFSYANLVGVDFSSDLSASDGIYYSALHRVKFIGADLYLANFQGTFEGDKIAIAEDIEWNGARCPDGIMADDNGGTCIGHLLIE